MHGLLLSPSELKDCGLSDASTIHNVSYEGISFFTGTVSKTTDPEVASLAVYNRELYTTSQINPTTNGCRLIDPIGVPYAVDVNDVVFYVLDDPGTGKKKRKDALLAGKAVDQYQKYIYSPVDTEYVTLLNRFNKKNLTKGHNDLSAWNNTVEDRLTEVLAKQDTQQKCTRFPGPDKFYTAVEKLELDPRIVSAKVVADGIKIETNYLYIKNHTTKKQYKCGKLSFTLTLPDGTITIHSWNSRNVVPVSSRSKYLFLTPTTLLCTQERKKSNCQICWGNRAAFLPEALSEYDYEKAIILILDTMLTAKRDAPGFTLLDKWSVSVAKETTKNDKTLATAK